MQATTGARGTGEEAAGSQRGVGRASEAEAPQEGSSRDERFTVEQLIRDTQTGHVGRVVIIYRPAPILYGVELSGGSVKYVYDADAESASPEQVEAYRDEAKKWAAIRGPRA
jgi:hypothetical protein